jgi:hypothetical protein
LVAQAREGGGIELVEESLHQIEAGVVRHSPGSSVGPSPQNDIVIQNGSLPRLAQKP